MVFLDGVHYPAKDSRWARKTEREDQVEKHQSGILIAAHIKLSTKHGSSIRMEATACKHRINVAFGTPNGDPRESRPKSAVAGSQVRNRGGLERPIILFRASQIHPSAAPYYPEVLRNSSVRKFFGDCCGGGAKELSPLRNGIGVAHKHLPLRNQIPHLL